MDPASTSLPSSRSRLLSALPPLLVVLAVTIPCWTVLFAGQTFYYRDIYLYFLPQRALVASIIASGHLPIWDPYFHAGSALWANPDNLVAHPSTLFYLIAPATLAFGLTTATGLALAGLGAFFLARRLGLSSAAAIVASGAFALSGVMTSVINLPSQFLALCPLPALLCAWDAWIHGRSRRILALFIALAALIGLSSGAEAAICGAVLLLLWTVFAPGPRPVLQRLAVLAACGVVALALSSPAWLPALEVIGQSNRGDGYAWDISTLWAVDPARLPELIVPGFLGDIRTLNEAAYWGRGLEDGFTPYFLSISLGPVAFVLALIGMGRGTPLPTGLRRALVGLFIASVVLAVAPRLPGVSSSDLAAMMRTPMRFPVKFLQLGVLPAAILVAAGFDASMAATSGRRRWPLAALLLAAMALGLALIVGIMRLSPETAHAATIAWFRVPQGALLPQLSAAFTSAALLAALAAASIGLATRPHLAPLARVMLAVIVVLGLVDAAVRVNPTAPREVIETLPPLVETLRQRVGEGRLYRSEDAGQKLVLSVASDDAVHLARWNLDTLRYYTATRHGIPVAFHVDPDGLGPGRVGPLSRSMLDMPWPNRMPLLASAGVRAVLTNETLHVDGLVPREVLDLGGGAPTRLYDVPGAAPTIRFVPSAKVVPSDAAAIAAVTDPQHDPREQVVIVGSGQPPGSPGCIGSVAPGELAHAAEQEAEVEAGCDGFVVLALPFQPGLTVDVDGVPQPLIVADAVFCAVKISRGRHALTWRYRSRHLPLSLGLSALGAGLVVALTLGIGLPRGEDRASAA